MTLTMKRIALTAAAAAGISSALAANVQVYGVIDQGMSISHREYADGTDSTTAKMASGQYIGSRWGIKGTEDLGNGVKVGFDLEGGISSDSGSSGQSGRLFGRDSRLFLQGNFGLLSFGRTGSMMGGNGTYARFGHIVSPFSCGWGDVGGTLQVVSLGYEYIDNVIAWSTPKFGGWDADFQYSFGSDVNTYGDGTEGKSSVERMYSASIRYEGAKLMAEFGVESINQAQPAADENNLDDAFSYNLGGSYNAGWAKFYGYAQYFHDYASAAKVTMFSIPSGVDGWGAIVGIDIPAWGGTFKASFGYGDSEGSHESEKTMKTYQTAVGYNYWFNRRNAVYIAADWIKSDYSKAYTDAKPTATEDVYELVFGFMHKF
jgi:predicted porin